MNVSASKGEADWSDAPTGRVLSLAGWARPMDTVTGVVRTSQFLPHDIEVLAFDKHQSDGLPPVNPADSGVSP